MQKFSDHCELPASAERVAEAIMSTEYLEYRYKTEGVSHFELTVTQDDGDGFAYRLRRSIAIGNRVPRIVRNLVGEALIMIQEGEWERDGDDYLGHFHLAEERFSGGVDVEVRLESADPDICRLSFEGKLQVNVPLVGRQLEKLMVEKVSDSFTESIEAIEEYLESRS